MTASEIAPVGSASRSQVFTPVELADRMANWLELPSNRSTSLLDPGAGAGALVESAVHVSRVPLKASLVEKDAVLAAHLQDLLTDLGSKIAPDSEAIRGDFLQIAQSWRAEGRTFERAVMNPPYSRVRSGSDDHKTLLSARVPASNLFAAFLWFGVDLLEPDGRLIAVLPRAVMSGVQFRSLRRHLADTASLIRLHHFRSRRAIFERDAVQQEVVVLGFEKAVGAAFVHFSQSEGLQDMPITSLMLPRSRFMDASEDDVMLVPQYADIHEPGERTQKLIPDGVSVSVGSVVDFRSAADIVMDHETAPNARVQPQEAGGMYVPLIGSEQFGARRKRKRWLRRGASTERFIYPPGRYIVIKRISPPEVLPRLRASLVDARGPGFEEGVAFENHVLVMHRERRGLGEDECSLMLQALASHDVQTQIIERSGTTQINVADVTALRRNSKKG